MPTPLENQILKDYATALSASDEINPELQAALIDSVSEDKTPTADAILAIVKANLGDQSA